MNVAPLTATAMSSAPAEHSGIASAVNNDVARAAGLIAVAVLPVAAGLTGDCLPAPGRADGGFHRAVLIAAAVCAARRPARLRHDPQPAAPPRRRAQRCRARCRRAADDLECLSCAIDGPPLRLGSGSPRDDAAPNDPGAARPSTAGSA